MGQEISKEENARKLAAEELLKKIKSNQPEDLTSDNDFLGTISKGNMIAAFLESLLNRKENDIQMIALYGEWGSGKTSLMKYVQKTLDDDPTNFTTVFFESWKLEKDENLALSLVDTIAKANKGNVGLYGQRIYESLKIISGAALSGVNIPIWNAGKAFDNAKQQFENKSFSDVIKTFESEYSELEHAVLNDTDNENRKLIVFIDDLDRCEPKHVLNLLAAMKLFFTYGNRTIFVCGVDKNAVDKAVKCQYGDVIKSGEYLEKIFDISFDMPKPDINKMIEYYFNDKAISNPESVITAEVKQIIDGVKKFFDAMHFTNPRHIKKVLNKYLLILYYQESGLDKEKLIPDQQIPFFRYLTLFIIMLYKFQPENFKILRDYDAKLSNLKNSAGSKNTSHETTFYNFNICSLIDLITKSTEFAKAEKIIHEEDTVLKKILALMFGMPMQNYDPLNNNDKYIGQFSTQDNLSAKFISFLTNNMTPISVINKNKSAYEYRLWNIFEMAELYL